MNVLEKILEEIKQYTKDVYECDLDDIVEYQRRNREDKCTYIVQGIEEATEFIRSNMGGAIDTDDTEEKIREHIAECLHRIDNIRSFIGSKEYISNDEKCIRNIEVLKTIITALEEYLSSKKKNGNDDWISVEERLPEEHDSIFTKFKGTSKWNGAMWEKQSDEVNVTYELEDGTRKATTSYSLDGVWKLEKESKVVKKKVVAWQPLPEPYRPKEKNNE